jgi:hypothetical protein
MPWWLFLYLSAIASSTVIWVRDDLREGERPIGIATELLAMVLLVLSALAYWLVPVRAVIGSAAPWIYVGSIAWILVSTIRGLRKLYLKPPFAALPQLASLSILFIGVLLFGFVHSLLIYWGYEYAFLGMHRP